MRTWAVDTLPNKFGRVSTKVKTKRIWVVICQFPDGLWEVCDFGNAQYATTNFHKAHKFKRNLQEYLQAHGSKQWFKRCFKVVEFRAYRTGTHTKF